MTNVRKVEPSQWLTAKFQKINKVKITKIGDYYAIKHKHWRILITTYGHKLIVSCCWMPV